MTPLVLQFGPWLPDLANVGVPSMFFSSAGAVPLADCLNIRFADGNYRCMESPAPFAPALASRVLNAYTWYDNNQALETVFAAEAEGIFALIDGAWAQVPLFNIVTSQATQMKATTRWGTFTTARQMKATTKMGSVTTTFTPDVAASVDGGTFHQSGTGTSPHTFTLNVTVVGGMATAWNWSVVSGSTTISNTSIANPTISVHMNTSVTIACTVTVGGNPIVATQGTYDVFNDA